MKSGIIRGTAVCLISLSVLGGITAHAEDNKDTKEKSSETATKSTEKTNDKKESNDSTSKEDSSKTDDSTKKDDDKKSNNSKTKAEDYSKNLKEKLDDYYNIKSQQYKANNKVEKLASDVSVIETKISDENEKIKANEEEISKIDKKLSENKEYLNKVARDNQINTTKSEGIFGSIFSKESVSNFIRQAMGENTIANAQKERVNSIKEDKELKEKLNEEIKSSQDNLSKQKEKLEDTKKELSANESVLSNSDKVQVLQETTDKLTSIREDINKNIESIKKDLDADKDSAELKAVLTSYEETAENISEKGININGRIVSGDTVREKIIQEAMKYIGVPYVWGGKSPSGFDCSGFTGYVYRQALGQEIGGWTVPQESSGTKIPVEQAQEGDLLFWGSSGGTHHVAISMGNGQYIHAPTEGETVKVSSYSSYAPSFAVKVIDD